MAHGDPKGNKLALLLVLVAVGASAGTLATIYMVRWRHSSTPAAPLPVPEVTTAAVAPAPVARPPRTTPDAEPAFTPDELAELAADIDRLAAVDPQPEIVRDVRVKLESTDWRAMQDVQGVMRTARSPAFVPMILRRAATDTHPANTQAMGAVFTMLTGQPLAGDRGRGLTAEDAAHELRTWWRGARATFTTDPCKMDRTTERAVLRAIAEHNGGGLGAALGRPAGVRDHREVSVGPGCEAMVPELLSMTDTPALRFGLAHILAALRAKQMANGLDAAIADASAPTASRVVAMAAIEEAGAPLPEDALLATFATTTDPELRQAMLRMMGRGDARVVPILLAQLTADEATRRAATEALRTTKSAEAVPALRKLLLGTPSSNGMRDVTQLLAEIDTVDAVDALAANLERLAAMSPPPKPEDWGNTQRDFEDAMHVGYVRLLPLCGGNRVTDCEKPSDVPAGDPVHADLARWHAWRAAHPAGR